MPSLGTYAKKNVDMLPSKSNRTLLSDLSPDSFNKFFCSIGSEATKHYGEVVLPDITVPPSPFEFLIDDIDCDFIYKYLCHLPNTTPLDLAEIDNFLLKIAALEIAPCLAHIFNLSLESGILPDLWKMASVTPVFKGKGNQTSCGYYRPVSIVPTIVKVLESFVKDRLVTFLKQHNLFSESQFAYAKGVSTETALHTLVNDVLLNMDKSNMSVTCMLDLTKGFDTVCHEILFYKLQNYGIHGHMLKWFKSYILVTALNLSKIIMSNQMSEIFILVCPRDDTWAYLIPHLCK